MCYGNSKVHTRADNSFVRINGWTLPLNGLQIFTWIVILYCGFIFFAIAALSVEPHLYPASYVCVGVFYVALVISLLLATSINPADDNSLNRNNDKKPRPVFNRSLHKHVIEKGYCHICEVTVGGLSKHCSVCNKCVSVFDHHCKWLNNCVGDKNYRIFLFTLVSAISVSVGMVSLAVFALVNSVNGFQTLDVWWKTPDDLRIAFQVLIGIQIVILLASLILITQLLCFHIMLICRGMTTYEYIKRTTRLKKETRPKSAKAVDSVTSSSSAPLDNNNCTKRDVSFVSLNEQSNAPQNVERNDKKNTGNGDGNGSNFPSHAYINESFTSDSAARANVDQTNFNNNSSSEFHCVKEDEALPNTIPDRLQESNKPGEHRKQRRKRRKTHIEPLNGATARPLPLPLHPLIESPSSIPKRNTFLPPVRDSVEWTSSTEDLTTGVTKRGKLPPLSTRSSSTSLTSSVLSEV